MNYSINVIIEVKENSDQMIVLQRDNSAIIYNGLEE